MTKERLNVGPPAPGLYMSAGLPLPHLPLGLVDSSGESFLKFYKHLVIYLGKWLYELYMKLMNNCVQ